MEALQAALASLVALEARAFELVSPVEAIADAVKAVVKEAAIVVESLHGRVTELEDLKSRVAALEARVVAEGPKVAAAPSAAATDVASTEKPASDAPGAVTFVDEPPAAAGATVRSDPLAGAPDVTAVFGFDKLSSAETTGT